MRGACDEQTCEEWHPTKQECNQKCQPPAASTGYRLLTDEDVIQTGDEFLDDDAETWVPVGRDSSVAEMWMIGMVYSTRGILKPFRRRR